MKHLTALIVLHWLLAVAVIVALYMGRDIALLANELDLKVDRLQVHMIAGVSIGLLFLVRLAIKLCQGVEKKPLINKNVLASSVHFLFYVVVFSIVITGMAIAIEVDMKAIISLNEVMPENLGELTVRNVHGLLTKTLIAMILLHVLAALYHQFILKDRIFSKIS